MLRDTLRIGLTKTFKRYGKRRITHTQTSCYDCRVTETRYVNDFDYHDLTATICINSKTLSGSIDIWDEEGTWCDTLFCQSVPFKK